MRLIAHRGASGCCPENTLAAFRKALELGAQALEFDVQQAKDGELVIIHDTDLKRVASRESRVGEMGFGELARLDVGSWFDKRFQGERIPRLSELFELVANQAKGTELQLEIKQSRPPYAGIEEKVLGLMDSWGVCKRCVVISSFHHPTLARVRALDPEARLGYLAGSLEARPVALKSAKGLGCESVHISLRQADPAWVRQAHALKMELLVYTVNGAQDLKRLKAWGVDGVFTNYPDLEVAGDGSKSCGADIRRARL